MKSCVMDMLYFVDIPGLIGANMPTISCLIFIAESHLV